MGFLKGVISGKGLVDFYGDITDGIINSQGLGDTVNYLRMSQDKPIDHQNKLFEEYEIGVITYLDKWVMYNEMFVREQDLCQWLINFDRTVKRSELD